MRSLIFFGLLFVILPLRADHYVKFHMIAKNTFDYNNLFEHGNKHAFDTCLVETSGISDLLSKFSNALEEVRTLNFNLGKTVSRCAGSTDEHFQEVVKYTKILTGEKNINEEIYEKYKIISNQRTKTILNFANLLEFKEIEELEKSFDNNCKEYLGLFKVENDACFKRNNVTLSFAEKTEDPITQFQEIASKEALNSENNKQMQSYLKKLELILNKYRREISTNDSLIAEEIKKEKIRIEKAEIEKRRLEKRLERINELVSNFKNQSKLFGVELLSNPNKYKILGKEILKKDFAGGISFDNTTYEYYKNNYDIEVRDIIYKIVPDIINSSFQEYYIISREFNEKKIITDIIARGKLINKGNVGCNDFHNTISDALFKKYGFVFNQDIEAIDSSENLVILILLNHCLIGNKVTIDPWVEFFNADTYHLRLKIKLSEKQFLEYLSIDKNKKKEIDNINF